MGFAAGMREGRVKKILLAAALGGGAVLGSSSVLFAQAPTGLLPPGERKAYNACLRARWIDDYCRVGALRTPWNYGATYDACLLANGVPLWRVPVGGPRDPCWYVLQTR